MRSASSELESNLHSTIDCIDCQSALGPNKRWHFKMSENKNQKPLGKLDWGSSIIKRMINFVVKGVINSVVGKIIGTLLIDFTFIAGAEVPTFI